ncbi:hypothetical protein ANN_26790 [Periplaneta americana]|uniref:Reverse transcriptase domain-containing protein n=1 Tax=Periplaneta americana TaxID=6978 RepID=A0ABQ8RZ76_PERAM|nr:hypothetical protein ANN_26790 [Periplaneta americana]
MAKSKPVKKYYLQRKWEYDYFVVQDERIGCLLCPIQFMSTRHFNIKPHFNKALIKNYGMHKLSEFASQNEQTTQEQLHVCEQSAEGIAQQKVLPYQCFAVRGSPGFLFFTSPVSLMLFTHETIDCRPGTRPQGAILKWYVYVEAETMTPEVRNGSVSAVSVQLHQKNAYTVLYMTAVNLYSVIKHYIVNFTDTSSTIFIAFGICKSDVSNNVMAFVGFFNDAVSTTSLFSVDEICDSEMIFGEMRPRIRHRLTCIHITVEENLGKNPTRRPVSTLFVVVFKILEPLLILALRNQLSMEFGVTSAICKKIILLAIGGEKSSVSIYVTGLLNVTVPSFGDDMVIVGKDSEAAKHIAEIATGKLHEIGLKINAKKSKCISIVNSKLNTSSIYFDSTTEVPALDINGTVKYLGVSYNDETVFNSARTMDVLLSQLERLTTSLLLQPYQKYNVVSSFICPKLVYSFQTTPPDKLPVKFLKDADHLIKSSIKDILQIPGDIPDNMLFSGKKNGRLRCLMEEAKHCLNNLQIDETEPLTSTRGEINTRKIRTELRQREYNAWRNLPQKGKDVILYSEFTPSNKRITKPEGMNSGEWKEAIKMTANVSAVRAIPARSQDNHYRRCLSEIETLGHAMGPCPYGDILRIHRHHAIRTKLADALRKLNYTVYEEVHGTVDNGSKDALT